MMQIVAKQTESCFLHYIVIAYQWSQIDVHTAEMYSKNQAFSYSHVIKQTVNTINSNDYMLRSNL